MPLLQVRHLKKYYATQKAVDDISFSIEKGSIFGLLGPNGAGKTTLLRMITGIFYPDEGEIFFDDRPFNPKSDIFRIGYMPEERGLYKKMKIGDHAVYLARLKGLSRHEAIAKVKEWFIKFEMQSWWNKKVEDLSKGMGQKLQFVTTVLHEPSLIILDEPFSGLDPVNSNLIMEEIFQLSQKGSTVIFSTHRMEQVEEICDQIVLVNKGKKILDGQVNAIKQDYKENYYRVTTDKSDFLQTNNGFSVIEQDGSEWTIQLLPGTSTNDVLQHLIVSGVTVKGFHEILPSLNDIFIRVVQGSESATRQFQSVTV